MKRLILLVTALTAISTFAKLPDTGYRGFLEWDNNFRNQNIGLTTPNYHWYSGILTSHGWQILPNFYTGLGVGIELNDKAHEFAVPLFVHFRTDQQLGKFTPFFDMRAGTSYIPAQNCDPILWNIYFSPTVGYRFNFGHRFGINAGIGLTMKGEKWSIITPLDPSQPLWDIYNTGSYVISGHKYHFDTYLTLRIGFDF